MDLYGDPAKRDEVNPFIKLFWERGSLFEREVSESWTELVNGVGAKYI
jgi:hypothetical protein